MKTAHPIKYLLLAKFNKAGTKRVLTAADFAALGNRPAIDKALSRLAREGVIQRLGRGLYVKQGRPSVAARLSIEAVAAAIARNTASRVIPTGALAANALGLSTQVPAKLIYLTDGRSRSVQVGRQLLIFKHASPRRLSAAGRTSAVVFQAMRYLGRRGMTDIVIKRLKTVLSADDKIRMRKDIKYVVGWMKPYLMRISEKDNRDCHG